MRRRFIGLFCLAVLAVFPGGCSPSTAQSPGPMKSATQNPNPEKNAGASNSEPLKLPLVNPQIEVQKAARRLLLFSENSVVRTYHIGLGLSPVGDKVREGDRRTPEGEYYIFVKNAKSAYYLSLGVSYPNLTHAKRGLSDRLITRAQYDRIADAIKRKAAPPQSTALGGLIYIHGNGARTDWTWGCVALENEDIRELYDAITVGTPVVIKP